jgi:hypothetical protein
MSHYYLFFFYFTSIVDCCSIIRSFPFKLSFDHLSVNTKWDDIFWASTTTSLKLELPRMYSSLKLWQSIDLHDKMVEALESNKLCRLLTLSSTGDIQLTHSCMVNTSSNSIIGVQGNDLSSISVVAQLSQDLFAQVHMQLAARNQAFADIQVHH